MVPSVSWATDSPTQRREGEHRVHQPLAPKTRLLCGPCRIEVQRLGVHRQRGEQHVIGFGDRPAGPVQVGRADLELLKPQAALDNRFTRRFPPSRKPQRSRDEHQLHLGGALTELEDLTSR